MQLSTTIQRNGAVRTTTPAMQPTGSATPELGNHVYSSISFKSITPRAELGRTVAVFVHTVVQ